jgi:hypothetical protein
MPGENSCQVVTPKLLKLRCIGVNNHTFPNSSGAGSGKAFYSFYLNNTKLTALKLPGGAGVFNEFVTTINEVGGFYLGKGG